jgi:hypothetical protein
VGNRCIPTDIEAIANIIEKSELIQALYNIQVVGSLNGVSLKNKSQKEVDNRN